MNRRVNARDADFQRFVVLKTNRNKRHRHGEFIAEGVRNINAAVNNGWFVASFIYPHERELSQWADGLLQNVATRVNYALTDALMAELSGKDEASELMAVIEIKKDAPDIGALSGNPVLALFDTPSNKGNLGTFLRSCDAFGVELAIITGHAVDPYDPEVITSSMGSFFAVPFTTAPGAAELDGLLSALRGRYPSFKIIGTTAHNQTAIYDFDLTGPILFMIGNETAGLSRGLTDRCDALATIPMHTSSSASSLNVSCAATAIFYEASRQRAISQTSVAKNRQC